MNRIHLICIGVRDMERSLAFYKGVGFKTYTKGDKPPIVFFDNLGTKLELYPIDALARDINEAEPPRLAQGGFKGITFAINLKSEAEVDAFIETVALQGGEIVKRPQHVDWGGYSGYFLDPDGVHWEVAYAEFWEFDEGDMLVIEDRG